MEVLDTAMKIITGPWDGITWIIVFMFGSSALGIIYKLFTGKSFESNTSYDDTDTDDFTDYTQRYSPLNIWHNKR